MKPTFDEIIAAYPAETMSSMMEKFERTFQEVAARVAEFGLGLPPTERRAKPDTGSELWFLRGNAGGKSNKGLDLYPALPVYESQVEPIDSGRFKYRYTVTYIDRAGQPATAQASMPSIAFWPTPEPEPEVTYAKGQRLELKDGRKLVVEDVFPHSQELSVRWLGSAKSDTFTASFEWLRKQGAK